MVIDEEEAVVVRAFFERCAAGESAASIARWANDTGHRTKVHGRQGGNRWSGRTVLQILRNPIYVGERVHAGGTVEGVHEGIIDADLAQRAWRAIDERRTRQPEPRGPALDWDRDPYMLRGLLRCAGCGRRCPPGSIRLSATRCRYCWEPLVTTTFFQPKTSSG